MGVGSPANTDADTYEEDPSVCPICQEKFSGYPGMTLHQRQSHPEVFHREEVTKISNSRNRIWTDEENELLADFEIANPEMRNINQHIR